MHPTRWPVFASLIAVLLMLVMPLAPVAAQGEQHGLDPANMDLSVDPGQDFYRFANGGWLDQTEIPSDRASYGVFDALDELTSQQLLTLLDDVSTSGDLQEGTDEWKAAEIFRQGVDIDTRNAQGIEPIQPILDEIDAIDSLDELHAYHQKAVFSYLTGLFQIYADSDRQDSTVNAAYLSSSFLGLPNRDYYLEDDESNAAVREAYIDACAQFLVVAGYTEAEARTAAQAVYDLEHDLAKPTLTREQQQDFSLSYNPMTIDELKTAYPLLNWDAYFSDLGLTGVDTVIVTEKAYLEALPAIVEATPLETLKDFYKLEALWSFANYLSDDITDIRFSFRGGVLGGITEKPPIEERVLDQANGAVGEAIGQLYVDAYFPPEAKQQITELTEAEIAAFRQRLEANTWMSDETKARALEKLDAIAVKVGYPDRWRSYEPVSIEDSYAMTFLSAANAETRRDLEKIGKPVDRSEWILPPQTVNAYYNPTVNEIVFPAAILQPPFFDYQGDAAANYGGIGYVIGHELTHGFDISGSQFDAEGNLVSWWTEEDRTRFSELNQLAVDQYGAVEVLPGLNVDGQITVGENVADLGGLQIAYDALKIHLAAEGQSGLLATPGATPISSPMATPVTPALATPMASPVAAIDFDALTPQQRFFISAATVWREKIRDEALETQVRTDVHAPAKLRATLPLQNMDEFYEAFDIGPGDAMYLAPDDRIVIW